MTCEHQKDTDRIVKAAVNYVNGQFTKESDMARRGAELFDAVGNYDAVLREESAKNKAHYFISKSPDSFGDIYLGTKFIVDFNKGISYELVEFVKMANKGLESSKAACRINDSELLETLKFARDRLIIAQGSSEVKIDEVLAKAGWNEND